MGNIIDYVESDFSLMTQRPFTAVDSLVLSQFAYVRTGAMVGGLHSDRPALPMQGLLRAELFPKMFENILAPEKNKQLLYALSAGPRWRDMRVNWYEDTYNFDAKNPEQFAAMTFLLPDGTAYLAFRGTDTTFLGWKEDFNMAYVCPVPSQTAALEYLEHVATLLPPNVRLRLGGHSKGGNVAVYAAMKCSEAVRDRIMKIYSHDGPGFREEVLADGSFTAVCDRIDKTLPQSSAVGMLLQSHEPYRIVKSDQVGGILQHDPFSWVVQAGKFVPEEKLTGSAVYGNVTLDKWLAQLPDERRAVLISAVFDIMDASGAKTFADFSANWQKGVPAMLKAMKKLDAETRAEVTDIIGALVGIAVKGLLPKPLHGGKAGEKTAVSASTLAPAQETQNGSSETNNI